MVDPVKARELVMAAMSSLTNDEVPKFGESPHAERARLEAIRALRQELREEELCCRASLAAARRSRPAASGGTTS